MEVHRQRSISWFVSLTMVSVCMFRRVCCVSFLLLSFKLSLGCLFRPHHLNQVSRKLPRKSLFTRPTLLKSLSGNSLGCGGRRSEHCRKCGVMIPQRGSCCCVWPQTSHSQISHPHAVSSWPICLFHPLPHSLSHALSASEHTRRQSSSGVDSPRVLLKL
jgi:hypothetical protein